MIPAEPILTTALASLTDDQFDYVMELLAEANRNALAAEAALMEVRRYQARALLSLQGAERVTGT